MLYKDKKINLCMKKKSDTEDWNSLRGRAIEEKRSDKKNFKILKYRIACIVEEELRNIKNTVNFKENNYGSFITK